MPRFPAIYARISSDRDGQQLGVRRQTEDCAALVARRGWPPAQVYNDDDISAYGRKPRPAYRQLLRAIAEGEVDAVVVWHLDRLVRQPKELEEFLDVCAEAGVKDLASVSGDIDLATHDGQLMARMLAAFGKKESDDKSRRIQRKVLELALAGKIGGGGTRPYGYHADRRRIIPSEARVIREVAARLLAGDSLRSVASDLNVRGIRSVTGREWQPQTLRRMILSARVSGQREHRGEIVAKAEWPPIIAVAQSARLRTLFADPDRRTNRTARRYLLKGLLRCGHCGATLHARPRSDGDRRYGCTKGPGQPGCGRTWILSEPLETFIAEAVLYRLDTPTLSARLTGSPQTDPAEEAHAELLADEKQLDELAAAYGEKSIPIREYLIARKPIDRRIEAARRRISRQRQTSALDGLPVSAGSAARCVADPDPVPAARHHRRSPGLPHRRLRGTRPEPL